MAILVAAAAVFFAAPTGRQDSSGGSAFESRLLATVPEDVNVIVPPAFSRHGRCVAYAARAKGEDRIVRYGRPGPPYEFI
ncbi:MAG: hypothetical protein HY716_06870 [Planctomycetes bacterium]|nr:hypothetical protein [Planctomycetota bacterium]